MSREPSPQVPHLNMAGLHRSGTCSSAPHDTYPTHPATGNGCGERANGSAQTAAAANGSAPRPSTTRAVRESAPRASVAAVSASVSRYSAASGSAQRPQPSLPRYTSTPAGGSTLSGGAAGAIKASIMTSTLPEGQFAQYGFDVAKYLKELVRRRDEAVFLRVLPKAQQLQLLVQQEVAARELAVQQEISGRMAAVHKALEDRARRVEAQLTRAGKERVEEMKRAQVEELAAQRAVVAGLQADTDRELRERLALIQQLHPKLNPINVALAEVKRENGDCAILAELLEEDKRVRKALKADFRFQKSKTAETDGGALPHWLRQCHAASFNVAAILDGSSLRASVVDAPSVMGKGVADRRVILIRNGAAADAPVVAWAHGRVAMPDVGTAVAALLPVIGATAENGSCDRVDFEVSSLAEAGDEAVFAGTVWPKEDAATVLKLSRSSKTDCACLQTITASTLSYSGVVSHELTRREISAIGESASE